MVGYTTAYDGGDIDSVYSTRELAEASWEYRNDNPACRDYEILEYELDLDPSSDKPDIDRRPVYGPKTREDQFWSDKWSRFNGMTTLSALTEPIMMPLNTGKEIQFFRYETPKETSK